MDGQLKLIAVTLSLFHLISASPSVNFVHKSLTLDLTTKEGDAREWIVSTEPDRILLLKIQSELMQPLNKAVVESILTISDSRDEASVIFPITDSESILPVYSTGNSVLIRLENKLNLNGVPKLQLKIEKAVSCPINLGGASSCGRPVDDVSCYCATFENRNWQDTKNYCTSHGMQFVAIETYQEDAALYNTWGGTEALWIGLSDIASEGNFIWDATGIPLSPGYSHWYPGEPNNNKDEDCVFYNIPFKGAWSDCDCSGPSSCTGGTNFGGICESQP